MTYIVLCVVALGACGIAYWVGNFEGFRVGFQQGIAFQKNEQLEREALIGKDDEA